MVKVGRDKVFKRKPGIVTETWWKRTVKEAFKHDPIRIIIELIKNSADSYTNLEKKERIKKPFKIFVELSCWPRKTPFLKVRDFAEGMSRTKLEKALEYGTETSLEDEKAETSAEKGIGLKDAMMAMENNLILTVKKGKLNERTKFPNFDTGEGLVDHSLTKKERMDFGIPKNGTIVEGKLPGYFPDKKFQTICKHLANHYMTYKLIKLEKFEIICVDSFTGKEINISNLYDAPKIDEKFERIKKKIVLPYQNMDYKFEVEINKSSAPLEFGKPYGKAGLYFYYGDYTVLDFSFGNSRYPELINFFGEVKMDIKGLVREGELFVDEKRKGLSDHPLNEALLKEIDKIMTKIAEDQREITHYSFKKESWMQKEMQKIYKDIKGKGKKVFQLPKKPKKFEFATPYTDVMEFESKTIFLIVNCSIISSELEISLKMKEQNIDILSPYDKKIVIKEEDIENVGIEKDGERFIVKSIKVYSEKKDLSDEMIATLKNYHQTKIGISLIANPIFNPKDGFEFSPKENGKMTITQESKKKIDLILDQSVYNEKNRKVIIDNLHPGIECAGKFEIPAKRNLDRYKLRNIIRYPVNISTKAGEIDQSKGLIKAFYGKKETEIDINIVPKGGIDFKGIKFVKSNGKLDISFYNNDGYILIYEDHPLVKKYKRGRWEKKSDCLTFFADIICREFIEKTIRDSIDSGSSKFQIINQDNPEPEIKQHFIGEYHKNAASIHEIQIAYLKTGKKE